jgi:hypothetical protein
MTNYYVYKFNTPNAIQRDPQGLIFKRYIFILAFNEKYCEILLEKHCGCSINYDYERSGKLYKITKELVSYLALIEYRMPTELNPIMDVWSKTLDQYIP